MGVGVFIGGFDQTFVVPVLSRMLRDFDIPIDEFGRASWILNGYLLGYTIAMPLMGRLADVYGHLRVFAAGLVIYMVGSVLVALSPNLTALTLARALTALGGGALVPVALAIAADTLPGRRRPLGLASVSVADDASSLLGPLWGTLIGVYIGWRWLFWSNVFLGIPVLVAVLVLAKGSRPRTPAKVDWAGGLLLTGGLASLTFALADAGSSPRPLTQTLGLYALAGLLLAVFVLQERRAATPLIDMAMFRMKRLVVANALFFLEGAAMITALVNIPLMAEVLWDRDGAGPGLMLMRMVLFMIVGGAVGGLMATIAGYRLTVLAASGLAAAGLFAMLSWGQDPAEWHLWLVLAIAGLGFTLGDASLYATVVDSIEQGRRASAVALLQVGQTMGMVVGMALLASQGLGRFDQRAAELFESGLFEVTEEQYRQVIQRTFDETYFAAGVVMLIAMALALWLPGRGPAPPPPS
jgi:MFS family permease